MKGVFERTAAALVAACCLMQLPATAGAAEGGLPEGEGRDVMISACTACHGLANIVNPHKPLSTEEWEYYLYDMVVRGAPVHQDDLEALRRYLVENFAND